MPTSLKKIHHSIKYSSNLSNLRHVFPRFSREFHQSARHEHLPFSARRSSEPFPPFRLISAFRSPHDPATGRIPCGERLSRLVARDLGQTFGVAGRSLANTPCARVRNVGARNAELKKRKDPRHRSEPLVDGIWRFRADKGPFWGKSYTKARFRLRSLHPSSTPSSTGTHSLSPPIPRWVAVGLNLSTTRHPGRVDWASRRQHQPAT